MIETKAFSRLFGRGILFVSCFRKYGPTAVWRRHCCGDTSEDTPAGRGGEGRLSWWAPVMPKLIHPAAGLRSGFHLSENHPQVLSELIRQGHSFFSKVNFKKLPPGSLINFLTHWVTSPASSKWGWGQLKIDICQWSRLDCRPQAWWMLSGQLLSGWHSPHHWPHESPSSIQGEN